jgi:hypothetical protein
MAIKIDQKIIGLEVAQETMPAAGADIIQMHEKVERPEMLLGATYKLKTPLSEHALYVTINDIVLNAGTPHEHRRPFEVFINSKNMDHFQWIVALTRIISAVFRKGGDVIFLVDELRSVFDPRGGYFKKGRKYMPSLVAEIGDVIEAHLRTIGMLAAEEDPEREARIAANRAVYASQISDESKAQEFPINAAPCAQCQTKAVVALDNCMTCLNCGDSKCG